MPEMYGKDPVHPIVDRVHEYQIRRLDYHHNPEDASEDYLDLVLQREEVVRRLRFLRPHRLKIEENFPWPTWGMIILDIRNRQWEGLNVEVADFESDSGSITFYAHDVIDLDAVPPDAESSMGDA